MARRRAGNQARDTGATLNGGTIIDQEDKLWAMADALRGSMDGIIAENLKMLELGGNE
ncbi:MAG: hypothetical protein OXH92_01470 [Bryobacterales bacterium]|nr:hypothetical protein [Bryobacterales bacterium]MDE0296528.1 hypothetical protein [Bryobacterales bacterium]MDE0432654.1 hypothetical protein [Bryobacterales bacterium]